jgi:hypothetical protein
MSTTTKLNHYKWCCGNYNINIDDCLNTWPSNNSKYQKKIQDWSSWAQKQWKERGRKIFETLWDSQLPKGEFILAAFRIFHYHSPNFLGFFCFLACS